MAKAKTKREVGDEYLARVLQHVPEAQRAAVQEALQADAVRDALGEGVLMKEDYSRLTQETKTAKDKFEALYESNKEWIAAKGEELATLKVQVATLGSRRPATDATTEPDESTAPAPKPAPAAELPKDIVRTSDLKQLEGQAAGFIQGMLNLGMRHLHEWKEPLDLAALEAHCREVGKHALQGGYESFMAERRAEKAAQARKDEEAAIRKDERERTLREMSAPPAPSADGALLTFDEGTLAGLNKDRTKEFGVDAAVRNTMLRRQQKGA